VNRWITRRSRSFGDRAARGGTRTQRTALVICALLTHLVFLVVAKLRIGDIDLHPAESRGAIFASNHRSMLDFFVGTIVFRQLGVYPHTFVRGDFFARPILGRALKLVGAIPAAGGRSAIVTLKEAHKVLRNGGIITLAPEGRVVPPEERPNGLGKLKRGIGVISSQYGTPILLAAMKNTDKAWPANRRTPVLHLPWNRPTITVSVTWLKVQAGATPSNITEQVARELSTLLRMPEHTMDDL